MTVRERRSAQAQKPGSQISVLILSVLIDPEFKAIEKYMPSVASRAPPEPVDEQLHIQRWELSRKSGPITVATAFINSMGNAASALETYIYLDRISPRFIFLCGISGSLQPDVGKLGDVVAARSIDWMMLNKVSDQNIPGGLQIGDRYFRVKRERGDNHSDFWNKKLSVFSHDSSPHLPSNAEQRLFALKSTICNAAEHKNAIHFGGIVSWEFVLSDERLRDYVAGSVAGSLAIEMEGAGFEYAVRRRNEELSARRARNSRLPKGVIGFIFRGVSDLSHMKGTEKQEWRQIAMHNSAWAVVQFLSTISDENFVDSDAG